MIGLAITLGACRPPLPSPPPPPPIRLPVAAVVHGRITTEAGVPVEGAEVYVTVVGASGPPLPLDTLRLDACEGPAFPSSRSVTDRAGRYRQLHDYGTAPEFEACITIHVLPPERAELLPGTASGARVRFRTRHPSDPPRDTVFVGFPLRDVAPIPRGGPGP